MLVDNAGYWAPLERLLEHVVAGGFARPDTRRLYTVVESVDDIFDALAAAPPPAAPAREELI